MPAPDPPPHEPESASTQLLPEGNDDGQELRDAFFNLLLDLSVLPDKRHFQLVRRLGRGRQGVVLEAQRRGFLNCVTRHALKVFDPRIFPDRYTYIQDMRRVARQTSRLQQLYHPNLVQADGFISHGGVAVLVLEIIDGVDVRSMLERDPHDRLEKQVSDEQWQQLSNVLYAGSSMRIQPGVVVYILRKVLRGLELLHREGYIHCDIKPSNIMLDRNGTVKLIDFGRATSVEDDDEFFVGSPMYMAPELHERRNLSPSVDLYSSGIVALELLTGGYLLDPHSNEREIYEYKHRLPQRLPSLLPEAARRNEQLVHVLRRLVAVSPDDRYENATEAEVGNEGAIVIHQQLTRAGMDVDYGRELGGYVDKRLQAPGSVPDGSSGLR